MEILLVQLLLLVISLSVEAADQPNIVFIMADDLGFNDVGYHGSEIMTPNIDRLALTGVRLENYYTAPSCGPTRSQLLSGKYNIHTGTQHGNFFPCRPYGLPLEFPTIADKLKEQGYLTHLAGKWHIGFHTEDHMPLQRGFDTFRGMLTGSADHLTHYKGAKGGLDMYEGNFPLNSTYGHYSTHIFTRRAENVILTHKDREEPMFLFLSYQAPHTPLYAPKVYKEMYDTAIPNGPRKTYAAMVTAIDEGVGQVIDALKNANMYNNTVIIFSTDNGGQAKSGASNAPLRGNKDTWFEGGIRGVGVVSGPPVLRGGAINDELIHVTDWMPTLLHLAGGNVSNLDTDGMNQWNSISLGMPSPRKEILLNIDPMEKLTQEPMFTSTIFDTQIQAAIRVGDWKLLTGDPGFSDLIPAPLDDYIKYITMEKQLKSLSMKKDHLKKGFSNVQLYNIAMDPSETTNLIDMRPDIALDLLGKLAEYQKTALLPNYPKNDRRCNPARHGGIWRPYLTNSEGETLTALTFPPRPRPTSRSKWTTSTTTAPPVQSAENEGEQSVRKSKPIGGLRSHTMINMMEQSRG